MLGDIAATIVRTVAKRLILRLGAATEGELLSAFQVELVSLGVDDLGGALNKERAVFVAFDRYV